MLLLKILITMLKKIGISEKNILKNFIIKQNLLFDLINLQLFGCL